LTYHHVSARDHELIAEIAVAEGAMSTETYSYEEGSIIVHIVDARTQQDIWIGWAQSSVEPALRGPEEMRRWVYAMVTKMFATWPVPQR
jgi:hypothetical protein